MRGDARHGARQVGGINMDLPDIGNDVGLRMPVRQGIERFQAMSPHGPAVI